MMKLKDRVVIITGAGGGIGRASALEFIREGARVVVADINPSSTRETVKQIEALGGQGLAVQADVASAESVEHLVQETLRVYGQVHVLFNDAAIQINKTIEDTTVEEWNREMAVNLGGIFLCSKYSLPHLRKTRGCIVNMASVNGYFVEPMCAGYCASKGAIIALTKTMARKAFASTAFARDTSTPGALGATSNRSPTLRQHAPRQESSTPWEESVNPKRWDASPSFSPATTLLF